MLVRWPTLVRITALLVPLAYGVHLGWSEWTQRVVLAEPHDLPPPPAVVEVQARSNPTAIATVLGLSAEGEGVRSTEPFTLRASFVSSVGESRALLAGSDGERIYRVGESLPGGSVLRRVEITQVVLWRQGREELLPLQPIGERTLQLANAQGRPRNSSQSPLFLRPAADLPQSD